MTRRRTAAAAGLLASTAAIAIGAGGVGAKTRATRSDAGTAYASVNRAANGIQYVSGNVSDKLFGKAALTAPVTLTHVAGTTFKMNSTGAVLYTRTGSLKGTLSATITVIGTTTEKFSNGKIKLTTGAGSQKGHSLVGSFSGSGSTSKNQFTLHYTATYK